MTTATTVPPAPAWDLEVIFPGGSKSPQFLAYRQKAKDDLAELTRTLSELPNAMASNLEAWTSFVLLLQSVAEQIHVISSFSGCLIAQNVDDSEAQIITGEGDLLVSQWEQLKTGLEAVSLKQSDEVWSSFVSSPELVGVTFFMNETREHARRKLAIEQESLVLDLSVNGYHAWNRLYDKMAGDLRVDFDVNGETKSVSMGQLATFMDNPDRSVRRRAFEAMVASWNSRADLAAMALNAQAGFRLSLYKRRGWNSFLYEPLRNCRLSQASLDCMWHVIGRETARLAPYIEAKKRLLGIDKFRWYDEFAACGHVDRKYPYDEAAAFIIDNVRTFSPHMADFYRTAIDQRWIEAEDRSGKAAGGFCTYLPTFKQSRIFMTYAGTYENLLTLAHELGHAYHTYALRDVPYFSKFYPMTLAETASIFSETLVNDAALQQTSEPKQKLMLVDQILQQAYIFFTDIHCRYLFDQSFYAERGKGIVGKDRLSELMIDAQKKAYGELLDESGYHPLFWCSKLHFYMTDQPFYNFPYTFGYLFAGGVFDRARKEGSSFAARYRALLEDSGRMSTEQVAMKHLDVDLTKEEFWRDAVNRSLSQVDTFVRLAQA